MSFSQKRAQRRATVIGVVIGGIIIFTFVISLIAPDLGTRTSDNVDFPTLTPFGTLPPPTRVIVPTPEPDPQLQGALPYIHSTGLFQTFRPAGDDWITSEGQGTDNTASAVVQSPARLAVIHNYIRPGVQYDTPESLSTDFLNETHFVDAWTEYDSWQETHRAITDARVVVDFDLRSNDIAYLGRSIAWVDEGWLYVVRMVTPANNRALLDLLQASVVPSFKIFPPMQTLPPLWPAHVDQELGYVLKHPEIWQIEAGGVGRPVTFAVPTAGDTVTVRVRTIPDRPIESEEQAQAWLTEAEPTAEVLAVEPIAHDDMGTGYQIAYSYRDTAGDPHSGLVVLLNSTAGTLYVANLQSERAGTNWLDAESLSQEDSENVQALISGFIVLPAEDVQPAVEPAATPDSSATIEVTPTTAE
jgi:hypothetical protein